jgi:RecA/RadA recombinase
MTGASASAIDLRDARPFGWAYRAQQRFIDTLSPEIRAHLGNGGAGSEPYVVVFGRTQVGKTTLLLELMGVAAHAQQRVGAVLRGGRAHGKSATATTMEYRRSPDAAWRLGSGPDALRFNDDPAMCAALAELREAMSTRRLDDAAPVVVAIPDDCFDGSGAGGGPRMLDLPGDNPAEPVEADHVRRMAERYVPYADLILLVGRADDLTFLYPEALALPGIEDWQLVPNRFRIVTTYSFTPYTVRQYVEGVAGELDPAQFRAELLREIDTFGRLLAPEARAPQRFFPLEIGDSWRGLEDADAPFAKRVAPVLRRLKDELKTDIRDSANEAARFRNTFDVHVVAQRKRDARRQESKAELDALDAHIEAAKAAAELADKAGANAAERELEARRKLEQAPTARADIEAAIVFEHAEELLAVDRIRTDNQTNTAALFERMNGFRSWLRRTFLRAHPGSAVIGLLGRTRADLEGQAAGLDRIVDDELHALSARLGGYWNSEYYPSVSNSFSEDLSELRSCIARAAARASTLARERWQAAFAKRCAELSVQAARAAAEHADFCQVGARQEQERQRLLACRAAAQAEFERIDQRLQQDEQSGKRFVAMLQQEYLAELGTRYAIIANPAAPVAALLALLSTHTLAEERRQIAST